MESTTILIVEDDPIIAADLQDRLTESGYAVLGPVAAGEEALPFFQQANPPDLVLMDIQLEGEWDGIETTRRIREQHGVPVIFLTSNSDDKTFREARRAGPQAFLSKPFRGRDLRHAIELAIQQAARHSDRSLQLLQQGQQSLDHPIHPAIPETAYLKAFFMRVLPTL